MKPFNKLTTRPWSSERHEKPATTAAQKPITPSTTHAPFAPIFAVLSTTTRKPPSSTVITINYGATHSAPKSPKPSTYATTPKHDSTQAQSKIESVTAKFDSTHPTTPHHTRSSSRLPSVTPTTTKTIERKSRPTKQQQEKEKKAYSTRPSGKISRGTIKFNDSKPV